MPLTNPDDIASLLQNARTIAMVGASDRPDRPSFGVMSFLQSQGYRVIPVNPTITGEHVHGEYVWRELSQIGEPIDIVDIFRRSDQVSPIVDQAIANRANAGDIAAVTGAYVAEGSNYLQSTGFVLDKQGRILTAVYSSGAIGRLVPDDVIGFVKYVDAHHDATPATAMQT